MFRKFWRFRELPFAFGDIIRVSPIWERVVRGKAIHTRKQLNISSKCKTSINGEKLPVHNISSVTMLYSREQLFEEVFGFRFSNARCFTGPGVNVFQQITFGGVLHH